MDIKQIKENCKLLTENLFKEKLLPVIRSQAVSRGEALDVLQKLAKEIETYQQKVEAAMVAVKEIQTTVDKEILGGLEPKKSLRELEVNKAALQACERHLERLADQDREALVVEEAAEKELTEALGKALLALRPDIEDNVRVALNEALALLIFFEDYALATCKEHDVELGLEYEKDFCRFLALDSILKDLSAFCSPIGRSESRGKRRKIRWELLAE